MVAQIARKADTLASASAPTPPTRISGLPYVTARYVMATGDKAVLDEILPFIEGEAVPPDVEGHVISPLPSRERATLFEHCRRGIEHTLGRFGANGLPLMGAGDWDDGMNLVGFRGRGESVWVGFFLYDILTRFIPLCETRGEITLANKLCSRAENLQAALDSCWRGDRFVRAFADDGEEVLPMGAMSSAWPALSGAVQNERGRKALENGLAALDKGDRVLLVTPPYDENSKPFGRSADYPPGVRENGGQYPRLVVVRRRAGKAGRKGGTRRRRETGGAGFGPCFPWCGNRCRR